MPCMRHQTVLQDNIVHKNSHVFHTHEVLVAWLGLCAVCLETGFGQD